MISDEEMNEGLTPGQAADYRKEAAQKWGEGEVKATEARIKKMSKEQWNAVKAEGEAVTKKLAELMEERVDPSAAPVQECITRWEKFLENFYPVTMERLRGLGQMYVEDERFTAHYEKYGKGLAKFMNKAIQIYCGNREK